MKKALLWALVGYSFSLLLPAGALLGMFRRKAA